MADFLSKHSGQEIDTLLDSVKLKVSKTDIVDRFDVQDSESPASARLTYQLNSDLKTMKDTLDKSVMRLDGGAQEVNGAKTFLSTITAGGGIAVPTGKSITIIDEPAADNQAVNLAMLKKHGVASTTVASDSGLKATLMNTGYYKFELDLSNLLNHSANTIPESLAVYVPGAGTRVWSMVSLFNRLFDDARFGDYVKVAAYDADMLSLETQISGINTTLATKVNVNVYNNKMSSLDASIAGLQTGKVNSSDYTTKMASLDGSISSLQSGKVDLSVYNPKMTSLDSAIAARVEIVTYAAKMTSLDSAIDGKVDQTSYSVDMAAVNNNLASCVKLTKTNTSSVSVAASGSTALPDFTLVNLCQVLVTAKWGALVDTFMVTITYDGTVMTTPLTQKSTAGTLTFAGSVVSGKLRLTMANANTTTAATVDYKLNASF